MLGNVQLIQSRDSWLKEECNEACLVKDWEFIFIESVSARFLYGTVIKDYYMRFSKGDYVFTSPIKDFDEQLGIVKTENSIYALMGSGEELTASMEEAYKMKVVGQSLHTIRAIERDVGTIIGRSE